MEIIGWIGSILFAICAVPQAIQSYKQKHSNGISKLFLALWFFGEVFTTVYILPKQDYPLLFNYSVNFACILVIGWYRFKPKRVVDRAADVPPS